MFSLLFFLCGYSIKVTPIEKEPEFKVETTAKVKLTVEHYETNLRKVRQMLRPKKIEVEFVRKNTSEDSTNTFCSQCKSILFFNPWD